MTGPFERLARAKENLDTARQQHMTAMLVFGLAVRKLYAASDLRPEQIAEIAGVPTQLVNEWLEA